MVSLNINEVSLFTNRLMGFACFSDFVSRLAFCIRRLASYPCRWIRVLSEITGTYLKAWVGRGTMSQSKLSSCPRTQFSAPAMALTWTLSWPYLYSSIVYCTFPSPACLLSVHSSVRLQNYTVSSKRAHVILGHFILMFKITFTLKEISS